MPRKKSLKLAKEAASSEDEWEDVAEDETEPTDVNIKSDVEIELDVPNVVTKHQKKQNQMREWLETMIKRAFNKGKKEIHIKMHQTHLLCLLCMGFQLNDICNHPEVQAKALSILPLQYAELSSTKVTLNIIQKLMQWINEHFKDKIIMQKKRILNLNTRLNVLKEVSEKGKLELKIDLVLFHLAIYRVLGIQARLVISLQPISYKPPSKKMLMEKAKHVIAVREKIKKMQKKIDTQHELDTVNIPQLDGANDIPPVRRSLRNRTSKSKPVPNNNSMEDDKDLTSVKSRYNFKRQTAECDKSQLPLNSNQNGFNHMGLSPSKKISQMAKANNSNGDSVDQIISPANRGKNTTKESKNKNNSDDLVLSPAKKISRMAKMSHNSLTSEEDEFIKKTSNKSVKKIQKVARKNAADTKEQCLEVDFTSIDKKPSSGKLKQSVKQLQEKVEKGSTRPPVSKTFSKYHNDKHQDSFANDKENVSCRALPAVTLVKTEALDCIQPRKLRTSRKRQIKSKESSPEHGNSGVSSAPTSSSEDDDFVEPKATSKRRAPLKTSSSSNKSTSKRVKREASLPKPKSPVRSRKPTHPLQDEWIEVYIPQTGWVNLDCVNDLLNDPKSAEANATQPLHYVIAFDGDACVKDVTARYASGWLTSTRKLRISYVEADWWKETLAPYQTEREAMDREENKQLESDLLAQPLPTSIAACKDHPLFALRRHLLKYEGIYPPDVPAIGFVRGEEILPRSAVHLLHTREKWLQSAMSVRDGEEPYKMVASFLLNKKLNRDSDTPSLPLFGKWQTEAYKPAVAKDGKVPRNDYGNVDLFQPSMLPIGCVHLRLTGLNTVARKLNIDVSTAIIGFDTHSGYPHPVTDGYVACQEHEAILREAWAEDQQHAAERARNKRDQRIYGNWKKLIRGLRALERVRRKYDNKKDENVSLEGAPTTSDTAWQAERLEEAKKQEKSKSRRRGRNSKKKKNELLPFESETL